VRRAEKSLDAALSMRDSTAMDEERRRQVWPRWSLWALAAVAATSLLTIAVTLNDIF
jgi:anti-sigma-K factor RskA